MDGQIAKPRTSPRDFFLHLLAIITLYVSAGNFIALLFQYINYFFPDPLKDYYYYGNNLGPIRWALATLVIIFPTYVLTTRYLRKDYDRDPEKRELKVRKWLIYFTLFAAGLIILGDLVALLRGFLEGELTTRFALKAVAVFFVAGAIFWYYLTTLKDRPLGTDKRARTIAYTIAGVVCAFIIGGFFIVGTPAQERLRQFDERRVGDLQSIQWQIINYWQSKETLPATLSALEDPIQGFHTPVDPATNESYEYRVTGARSFELCATFNLSSTESTARSDARFIAPKPIGGPIQENWQHPAGRVCFDRTIDPDFYPPFSKTRK